MNILFNLFINSIGSFLVSFIIVMLSIQIFRVTETRWKLYFLCLPFLKVIYDFYRGIPIHSFFYHRAELLQNLRLPNFKLISIGVGFSEFGPSIKFSLAVKNFFNSYYPMSFSDFLSEQLLQKITPYFSQIILMTLLSISTILIFRRFIIFLLFYLNRQRDRKNSKIKVLSSVKLFWRTVNIYLSENLTGSPFCSGLFNPYICISKDIYHKLTAKERKAVIAHELAHIRSFDIVISTFTQLFTDVFWFIPFIHHLRKKIEALIEILADNKAVSTGESPTTLATTLLKIKSMQMDSSKFHPQMMYFNRKNLVCKSQKRFFS